MFPFKEWMKHMAMVPKGFLRYQVLKLLSEKPMSGSEIMSEIENQTGGHWKPSPGSIYPLLAWLQDKGYIKESAEREAGTKRYALTDQGKTFLQEHVKKREEMRKRFQHMGPGPGMMGPMWFEFYPERAKELRKATRDLAVTVWKFRDRLRHKYSQSAAEEARKALEEAAAKIEDIMKKM
jgi:DNA-binding PadR family transcriptional regulator